MNKFYSFHFDQLKGANKLSCAIVFMLFICMAGVAMIALPGNIVDFILILLCLIAIVRGNIKNNEIYLKALVIAILFLLLSALLTSTSLVYYKSLILRFIVVYLVYMSFNFNTSSLKKSIIQVLWILTYLGIVNFLLYTFLPGLFSDYSHSGGFSVRTIGYIFNCSTFSTLSFMRNQCVFWEPGIYQFVLNILVFHIIIENRAPIKDAFWPLLMILTTGSTTGYIIVSIILGYRVLFLNKGNKAQSLLIIIVLCAAYPFISGNIQNKFEGDSSLSAASRIYDYVMGCTLIKEHPITGIGLDQNRYFQNTRLVDLGRYNDADLSLERGNTNSIVSMAVFLGLPFCIIFLCGAYRQRIFKNRFIFFLIFILSLCSEPIFISSFIYLIAISSLDYKVLKCKLI